MALMSTLRILSRVASPAKSSLRFSGHGPQLKIQPSHYMWDKFKDKLHFYVLLGVVPLTIITTYVNIFIGPATLTEIPEGYTPHYWEYYKHPVSRFLAKYFLYDKSIDYETNVAKLTEEAEIAILRKIELELKAEMSKKADNKSWYYKSYTIEDERFSSEWQNVEPFRYFGYQDSGEKTD